MPPETFEPFKPTKPTLGGQLKEARLYAGLTKAAVAREAGCSAQTVAQAESDQGAIGPFLNIARASRVKVVGRLPAGEDLKDSIFAAIARWVRSERTSYKAFAKAACVSLASLKRLQDGTPIRESRVHVGALTRIADFLKLQLKLVPLGQHERFYENAGFSSRTSTWETPAWVLELLYPLVGGTFALDPCSPHSMPDTAPVRAERYFTQDDDGLAQEWQAATVFCNPPYGRALRPWTAKCRREVEAKRAGFVVGLVPVSTGVRWWRDNVKDHADALLLPGRLTFGEADAVAPNDSALVLWGGTVAQRRAVRDAFPDAQWVPRNDTPLLDA